jgi:hypothetical protein
MDDRAGDPPEDPPADATGVDVAIQFMAQQQGGAERVLAIHRRLPDGRCRGCLTTASRWPCPVARLALRAQQFR